MGNLLRNLVVTVLLVVFGLPLLLNFGGIAFISLASMGMNKAEAMHDQNELPTFSGQAAALNRADGGEQERLRNFVNGTDRFNARRAISITRILSAPALLRLAGVSRAVRADDLLNALDPLKDRDCTVLQAGLAVACTPISFQLQRRTNPDQVELRAVYALRDVGAGRSVPPGALIKVETMLINPQSGDTLQPLLQRITQFCSGKTACKFITGDVVFDGASSGMRRGANLVFAHL